MSGQTTNQKVGFGGDLTSDQIDIYKEFNRMLESLNIQNLFKDFQSMLRQTDTGEIKINLTRSSEIERKTQEGGLL